MTVGKLMELLKSYPSDHEVFALEYMGPDICHTVVREIHDDAIEERLIFVNRPDHLDYSDEGEAAEATKAVLISNHHDETRQAAMNVEQLIECLRVYPPNHRVMLTSKNGASPLDYGCIKDRRVFEREPTHPGGVPELRLRKSPKTIRAFHAVIIGSYAIPRDTPVMTVESLIDRLVTCPPHSEILLERGSLFRLNESDFQESIVFENERLYLSATPSEFVDDDFRAVTIDV